MRPGSEIYEINRRLHRLVQRAVQSAISSGLLCPFNVTYGCGTRVSGWRNVIYTACKLNLWASVAFYDPSFRVRTRQIPDGNHPPDSCKGHTYGLCSVRCPQERSRS
ncbi:Hypothetical protein NTJ_04401 [Nesidiocoris tenuis]|uniref:Uncharacterized protein n=1 Tax=Nesidiocoris tenuis TaxID=355587 RepID=A0ABN7AHR9_9HEMI|nr:Hypothetical protein NTJ_04401 [Nesidiocoris tenuis]